MVREFEELLALQLFSMVITMMRAIRAVCLLAALACARARAPLDRPNIVLVYIDDLGYGDMGYTGHPTTRTPNIDRLAYNGRVLSTWYSASPVCTASRTALMTGRQPPRVGMPGVINSLNVEGLPLNETTLATLLHDGAGYRTLAIGPSSMFCKAPFPD